MALRECLLIDLKGFLASMQQMLRQDHFSTFAKFVTPQHISQV